MFMQILKGTPGWVFVLFFVLLALGVAQSRPRRISAARVAILPVVFLSMSLLGVVSVFGAGVPALPAWAVGVGGAVLLNRILRMPAGVRWDGSLGVFEVPASWAPLALMMTIFFARYAIAVCLALMPGLARAPGFAAAAGLAYGLLSGMFLARALRVWSQREASAGLSVQSIQR